MLKRSFIVALALFATLCVIGGEKTMANDVLTAKQQNIAQIASYTATGDSDNLKISIEKALNDGMTVNEIKEILVQMYAYCGFPRSLNAISTLLAVSKNGGYKAGEAGKKLPDDANKNKIGEKTQTELVGAPVKGEIYDFAPVMDDYLKEHLFADIFSRGVLSNQEREIATIAALSSLENVDAQLKGHIQCGKNTGLTQEQIDGILKLTSRPKTEVFALGDKNDAYKQYFVGQSYLKPLTTSGVGSANVTFEPGCRNNWHIHHKGGQILLVTGGRGYYQEWGKPAQELKKGDVVNIPPEVKHWHGAAHDSWFSHVAISVPAEGASTEWLEKVEDREYNELK